MMLEARGIEMGPSNDPVTGLEGVSFTAPEGTRLFMIPDTV